MQYYLFTLTELQKSGFNGVFLPKKTTVILGLFLVFCLAGVVNVRENLHFLQALSSFFILGF